MNLQLKNIATIKSGYQSRSRIDEVPGSEYRLIQGRDFDKHGNLNTDSLLPVTPERNPEPYMVQKGDTLLQSRGAEHKSYFIAENLKNSMASGSFYIIRVRDNRILPEYLEWWLNQKPARLFFEEQSAGTLMSFVSKSTIAQLRVQIPPIPVQQKIQQMIALGKYEQELLEQLTVHYAQLVQAACVRALRP